MSWNINQRYNTIRLWLRVVIIGAVSISCAGKKTVEIRKSNERDTLSIKREVGLVRSDSFSTAVVSSDSRRTGINVTDSNIIDSIHFIESDNGTRSIKIYGVEKRKTYDVVDDVLRTDFRHNIKLGDRFVYSNVDASSSSWKQSSSEQKAAKRGSKVIKLMIWLGVIALIVYLILPITLKLLTRRNFLK